MDQRAIEELGDAAIVARVSPRKRPRVESAPVLGLDTEYDSRTHQLISIQLSNGRESSFTPLVSLSVDRLAYEARRMIGADPPAVILVSFFSIAELQHLPVLEEAVELLPFGVSLDVVFESSRHALRLRIFDLARFFPGASLATAAKSYGLRKLEADREKVTRRSARSARFRRYAMHDAWLCYELARLIREGFAPDGVDPLSEGSPAAAAAAAFRANLGRALKVPSPRVRRMGMGACWGGRAEALERGRFKHLWEHDIVSAYPSAAIALRAFPERQHWRSLCRWSDARGALGGLGRFRFTFPSETLYPMLPVWTRRLHIYPLCGETFCTLAEIEIARSMGARVSIIEAFYYKRGNLTLNDYLEKVVAERSASKDPVRRSALKMLANALIGKLAQRVVGAEPNALLELARRKGVDLPKVARMTREECLALGIPLRIKLGSVFIPEWNALITGSVRAALGQAISSREAVYASTDCIWTRSDRPPESTPGSRWDTVRHGPAIVARTRLARMGDHVAHHSIWSREAGERILDDMDGGEPLAYTIERPIKFTESLTKGIKYGTWIEEERHGRADWDGKRRLASDGTSVPWESAAAYLSAAAEAYATLRNQGTRARGSRKKPR